MTTTKHTYDTGDDKAFGYDDVTLDVLGYAMAYAEVFSAKITFPEGTDLSEVSFRTNGKQEWVPSADNSEYAKIEGNVISISARPEAAGKGYTVQVLLPNGYFGHTVTFYWYYILFAVLALLGMLACVGLADVLHTAAITRPYRSAAEEARAAAEAALPEEAEEARAAAEAADPQRYLTFFYRRFIIHI